MIRDAPQHTILASDWSQPSILASDWLIRPWLPALAQEWQQSTKRKGVAASCLVLGVTPAASADNYWINKAKIFQNVNLEFINKSISAAQRALVLSNLDLHHDQNCIMPKTQNLLLQDC